MSIGWVYRAGAPAKNAVLTALLAASIFVVVSAPADDLAISYAISVSGVTEIGCKFVTLSKTVCRMSPVGAVIAAPDISSSIWVVESVVTVTTTGPELATLVENAPVLASVRTDVMAVVFATPFVTE